MNRPFSAYREWLASDEYKSQLRKLMGAPPDAVRSGYPADVSHLVTMHSELGTRLIHMAVGHFQKAEAIRKEAEAAT